MSASISAVTKTRDRLPILRYLLGDVTSPAIAVLHIWVLRRSARRNIYLLWPLLGALMLPEFMAESPIAQYAQY